MPPLQYILLLQVLRHSSPSTTETRLREAAKAAEANGETSLVRTVTIGSKEYYVLNLTGGEISDLSTIGQQAKEVDELFKAAVEAHGEDFTYMDAQGAHKVNGSVVKHSSVTLGDTGNHHYENTIDGGAHKKDHHITKNQCGMLTLYERILNEPTSKIDRKRFKAYAKTLNLPKEIQKTVLAHTSGSQTFIDKSKLMTEYRQAIAIYGKRLFGKTIEGLSSDKTTATATATYNAIKPKGSELARLHSKLNQNKAPTDVIRLEEQFAIHNVAARSVRTAQHAWNALAKVVDTTVHQGHRFPAPTLVPPQSSPPSTLRIASSPSLSKNVLKPSQPRSKSLTGFKSGSLHPKPHI